jgi:dihydrofolate reductase
MISIIAAMQKNRGIGFQNRLPWKIPEDMKRFKSLTLGHPVIMGRNTWESFPPRFRPLPDRTNIVLTRNAEWRADGAVVARSIEEALGIAKQSPGGNSVWIIGGVAVYEAALPLAGELWLTEVDAEEPADAFFPEGYATAFPNEVSREPFTSSSSVRAAYVHRLKR